jgi:hypothetical protein
MTDILIRLVLTVGGRMAGAKIPDSRKCFPAVNAAAALDN